MPDILLVTSTRRRFNRRKRCRNCQLPNGGFMHMPTSAESLHPIAVELRRRDPTTTPESAEHSAPEGHGHRILTAFDALAWASIGFLFIHSFMVSVDQSLCLIGCESPVTTSSVPFGPAHVRPLGEDASTAPDRAGPAERAANEI